MFGVVGISVLAFILKQNRRTIVPLLIEEDIQVKNSLTATCSDISNKLTETVESLENFFNSNYDISSQQEMLEYLKHIDYFARIRNSINSLEKLGHIRTVYQGLKPLKTKFKAPIKNEIFKEIDNLEMKISELEALQIVYIFLEAIDAKVEDRVEWLKNLCTGFFYLIELLESGNAQLIPRDSLKTIRNASETISSNEVLKNYILTPKDEAQQETIISYVTIARNAAKAVLWELEHQKKSLGNKRFKTIDELWEYWEEKYDEEEIEKSFETFKKGIDEERRKQGGRTLFS